MREYSQCGCQHNAGVCAFMLREHSISGVSGATDATRNYKFLLPHIHIWIWIPHPHSSSPGWNPAQNSLRFLCVCVCAE